MTESTIDLRLKPNIGPPANDAAKGMPAGRPNLLAFRCALEEAVAAVGAIRVEAMRQARELAAAGLDDAAALRSLAIAERNLAIVFGDACAALNRERAR